MRALKNIYGSSDGKKTFWIEMEMKKLGKNFDQSKSWAKVLISPTKFWSVKMLSYLILYWNVFYLILCSVANFVALVTILLASSYAD